MLPAIGRYADSYGTHCEHYWRASVEPVIAARKQVEEHKSMLHARESSTAYRRESGYYLIELNLREIRQLFNSLDPAPFLEKDLDVAAEEYIVDAVRELGLRRHSKLVIHLPPSGLDGESAHSIAEAIHHYDLAPEIRTRC